MGVWLGVWYQISKSSVSLAYVLVVKFCVAPKTLIDVQILFGHLPYLAVKDLTGADGLYYLIQSKTFGVSCRVQKSSRLSSLSYTQRQ